LTLVRTLVQLHGGEIGIESAGAGQGSEFTVRLPLSQRAPTLATSQVDRPNLGGLRVVLVEDHADIRVVTGRLLKAVGCDVTHAEDGASGIEAIAQHAPDLALVDIGLPDMDGYEVARQVRQSPLGHHVRLLALTGFGQPEDRQKALEAGFDDHLVKPLEYDALVSVIRAASQDQCDGATGEPRRPV
jgi:CheY-like chemotaxis protein